MALAAVKITIGTSLANGDYDPSVGGASVPDIATILTDITDALAAAGGAHDSTPEITTVQTDAVALTDAITGDVVVIWDDSTITHRNQLRAALRRALLAVEGGFGGLAE